MLGPTEAWLNELKGCGDPDRSAQLVKELQRDLDQLAGWLERAWDWFERNADQAGTADYAQREDRWIDRLALFTKVFDAVHDEKRRAA